MQTIDYNWKSNLIHRNATYASIILDLIVLTVNIIAATYTFSVLSPHGFDSQQSKIATKGTVKEATYEPQDNFFDS